MNTTRRESDESVPARDQKSPNDHQKTVQGKNQKGPKAKAGHDVGGGNAGSKGQNIRRQSGAKRSGKESRDVGDERGPHGGSGGGQSNRQNKAINRAGAKPAIGGRNAH